MDSDGVGSLLSEMDTSGEIQLHHPKNLLNANPYLPPTIPCILLITAFVELVDLESLTNPYITIDPNWNFNTAPESFWYRGRSFLAEQEKHGTKRLRFFVTLNAIGSRRHWYWLRADSLATPCSFSRSCDAIKRLSGFLSDYHTFHSYFSGPQYSLFLLQKGSLASKSILAYHNQEVFHTKRYPQPILFLVDYDPQTLQQQNGNHTPSGSYFGEAAKLRTVCSQCSENNNEKLIRRLKLPYQHFTTFCPTAGENCWNLMMRTVTNVTYDGTSILWRGVWTEPQLQWSERVNMQQKRLLDFPRLGHHFRNTLFKWPKNNSETHPFRLYPSEEWNQHFYHLRLTKFHEYQETPTDYIFFTEHAVESKLNAAELYLLAFDTPVWIWTLSSALLTSIGLATVQSIAKRSLSNWLLDVLSGLFHLGSLVLDQCATDMLPTGSRSQRLRSSFRIAAIVWALAILVLSNGFRGVLKSKHSQQFPYETSYTNWKNFTDFSLFTFYSERESVSITLNDLKYFIADPDAMNQRMIGPRPIDEAWLWWLINGEQEKLKCFPPRPKYQIPPVLTYVGFELLKTDTSYPTFPDWLKAKRGKTSPCTLIFKKCRKDVMQLRKTQTTLLENIEYISGQEFNEFAGAAYKAETSNARRIGLQGPENWNMTFTESVVSRACDGGTYTTRHGITQDYDTVRKAFWMTRKAKSAFVVHKSEFSWYWNLFKKAMVDDPTVRFAHTGSLGLRASSRSAIYERNDAPFYLYVGDRYIEQARKVIRGIAAVQESGIFNLWYKWDQILRPPRRERLNEETSEVNDEVRALKFEDPAVLLLVKSVVVLSLLSIIVFLGETLIGVLVGNSPT